ncbi:MAG: asparaginase, partial [Candidatus Thorarchaeota archaeon]
MTKNELPEVPKTNIDRDTRKHIIPIGNKRGENKGVLVIYTGGTIGCIPKDPNDPYSPLVVARWSEFRKEVPALDEIPFRIDAISFETPLDSANIGPQHWKAMVEIIGDQDIYDDYEGFVILHGTDTMVYTASMLSFMLQNLGKPVIITGSQRPIIKQVRNDALQNFITAILIANPRYSNIPEVKEVCIFFRDKLLRGNRTRKTDASGYTAFDSPNYPVLGTAGDRIEIQKKFLLEPNGEFNPVLEMNRDVIMIDIFPGFQDRQKIRDLIFDPEIVNAIVLKTYGTGTVPTESPEVIFSLDKKYKNLFKEYESEDGIEIKSELKDMFDNENCPLPRNPRLFKIDKNNWELSDRHDVLKDERYKIELKDDKINVYPFSFLDDIQMAVKRGQIIINVTQCPHGTVEQGLYDTSAVLTDCGVLNGQEITPEAALCKLMVILWQAKVEEMEPEKIVARINQNIAGEQNLSIYNTNLKKGKHLENKLYFWYRIPGISLEGIHQGKDRDRIERAILRFKKALVKKNPEYLFSISLEIKAKLANEKNHKTLLEKFTENNQFLSESFYLSKISKQRWKLIDGVNIYVIKDIGSELKVYEDEKPLEIRIYIDLPPDPDRFQEKRCFVDA